MPEYYKFESFILRKEKPDSLLSGASFIYPTTLPSKYKIIDNIPKSLPTWGLHVGRDYGMTLFIYCIKNRFQYRYTLQYFM